MAENVVKPFQPPKAPTIDASSQSREFDPLGQKYRSASAKQETPERSLGGQPPYMNSNECKSNFS